jgi:hypothetical protein
MLASLKVPFTCLPPASTAVVAPAPPEPQASSCVLTNLPVNEQAIPRNHPSRKAALTGFQLPTFRRAPSPMSIWRILESYESLVIPS